MEYEIDSGEPASIAVVRAVSAYTNTPPAEMDALYATVDPDALDCLVGTLDSDVRVEFEYDGVSVAVSSDRVSVRDEVVEIED